MSIYSATDSCAELPFITPNTWLPSYRLIPQSRFIPGLLQDCILLRHISRHEPWGKFFPARIHRSLMQQLFTWRLKRWQELFDYDARLVAKVKKFCFPSLPYVKALTERSCRAYWCPFCWARAYGPRVFEVLARTVLAKPRDERIIVFHQWQKSVALTSDIHRAIQVEPRPKNGLQFSTLDILGETCKLSFRRLARVTDYRGVAGSLPAGCVWLTSRRIIAEIVSRFCSYPITLLTAPVDNLVRILALRADQRLFQSYGVFRSVSTQKVVFATALAQEPV